MTPPDRQGAQLALPMTTADAARVLAPYADETLLQWLADYLGLPQIEPGRYDAADLLGLHDALRPWLRRKVSAVTAPS